MWIISKSHRENFFFFYIFAIHSSSRYEKSCQKSLRLFSLFQGSRNQLCKGLPRKCSFYTPREPYYVLQNCTNLGQVLEVVEWKFPYWKVYGELNWKLHNFCYNLRLNALFYVIITICNTSTHSIFGESRHSKLLFHAPTLLTNKCIKKLWKVNIFHVQS